MNKKIKVAIISHALVQEIAQRRWKKLSEDKCFEVHLLIPRYWETTWFGIDDKKVFCPEEVRDDNFHVHTLATTSVKNWGKYFFISFDVKFRKIKPDLIFIVHEESTWIHHQIYLYKKIFAPKAKVIFFSMNARGVPSKRFYHRWMWNNIKRNTDAALVHYPGCMESLRNGNYQKPIYLQTQIGVDETIFSPDKNIRSEYRRKVGFKGMFVIGYAGRLIVDKGVDDIVSVFIKLAKENFRLALLLVGNGGLKDHIEKQIGHENLEDRVHITGFVGQAEVPKYMNAMDIFVLGSKTAPYWIDTFPLVTVQAQACGVPVIASDSASLPWQLSDTAIFFQEGNRNQLKENLLKFISNKRLRNEYIKKGRNRSINYFCHEGMTEKFKKIVDQVLHNSCIFHEENEEYVQWKAY